MTDHSVDKSRLSSFSEDQSSFDFSLDRTFKELNRLELNFFDSGKGCDRQKFASLQDKTILIEITLDDVMFGKIVSHQNEEKGPKGKNRTRDG